MIHATIKKEPKYTVNQTLYLILESYKDGHYKNVEAAIKEIKELFKN